jgi:cAMP-dependent protein kinase regulator
MFNSLNPDELEIVLGAMVNVQKKANETIIREGEDGDNLYVVEKGTLTCTKIFVSIVTNLSIFRLEKTSPHS